MSYFTETFESILEFKGDAELAYAKRRAYERSTGWHRTNTSGSDSYKRGMDQINNNYHQYKSGRAGSKPDYDNASNDTKKSARLIHDELDKDRNSISHSIAKHNKKAKHESFDPVYEDLCRMGVID